MRNKILGILLLSIILLSSCTGKDETIITLNLTGEKPEFIIYTIPYDGFYNAHLEDSIRVDSLAKYEIRIPTQKTAFISLRIPDFMGNQRLLIEPGKNIELEIDVKTNYQSSIKIDGENKKGIELYLTFPNEYLETDIQQFKNDSSLAVTKERISELKRQDLSRFKSLLESDSISQSFYNLAASDRECYYAALEVTNSIGKMLQTNDNDNSLSKNIEDIYRINSLNDKNLTTSPYWYNYANSYILTHLIEVRDQINQNNIDSIFITEAKKHMEGKFLEVFEARYLAESLRNGRLDKGLIFLFDDFKKDFPNSNYIAYIEPKINEVIYYNEIINQPFKEGIQFVENHENINSLKDLIATQKSRKLYIDVWATWCGPCKREFAHSIKLKELLKSQNTDILYISIDREEANDNWQNLIKYYNLEGKHIRTNKNLYTDLLNLYGQNGFIHIPWYIQVDENGTITEWHAKSPSELIKE